MESSPWVRLSMAAAFYLFVVWGHLSLAGGTAFAIFYALAMAAMLVYWSNPRSVVSSDDDCVLVDFSDYQDFDEFTADDWRQRFDAEQIIDGVETNCDTEATESALDSRKLSITDRESLKSALTRLDVIKAELKAQYAQLGKDQTAWRSGDNWRFDGL